MRSTVSDLLVHSDPGARIQGFGALDRVVEKVVISPAEASPLALYVCLEPDANDADKLTREAVSRGCSVVLSAHRLQLSDTVTHLVAPSPGPVAGRMAAYLSGHPSRQLKVIAITGTNGKTTTTFFTKALLESAGERIGIIGTNVYDLGNEVLPASKTTPHAPDLQSLMARMVLGGLDGVAMEASSSGLMMDRLVGTEVDVGVFTNLTPDHMDHHFTMEGYFEAKARLFHDPEQSVPTRFAVINADDPWGRRLLDLPEVRAEKISIGFGEGASVRATSILPLDASDPTLGYRLRIESPWGSFEPSFPVFGRYNVYNALCAFSTAVSLGVDPKDAALAISGLKLPPGRLEEVRSDRGFRVFVDYGHDLGAISAVTNALREIVRGRLILLFGCNGRRGRVPAEIGRLAAEQSDFCVVTSDNPRERCPNELIEQVVASFPPGTRYVAMEDRREAIALAFAEARPGDVVLLAGKGHETMQVLRDRSISHDDRKVAAELLHR